MMMMSGLAVVTIQDTGMIPGGLLHACSPGRSSCTDGGFLEMQLD